MSIDFNVQLDTAHKLYRETSQNPNPEKLTKLQEVISTFQNLSLNDTQQGLFQHFHQLAKEILSPDTIIKAFSNRLDELQKHLEEGKLSAEEVALFESRLSIVPEWLKETPEYQEIQRGLVSLRVEIALTSLMKLEQVPTLKNCIVIHSKLSHLTLQYSLMSNTQKKRFRALQQSYGTPSLLNAISEQIRGMTLQCRQGSLDINKVLEVQTLLNNLPEDLKSSQIYLDYQKDLSSLLSALLPRHDAPRSSRIFSYDGESFVVKRTKGEGSCALHALLGTEIGGVYRYSGIDRTSSLRVKQFYTEQLKNQLNRPEVQKLFLEMVRTLVIASLSSNSSDYSACLVFSREARERWIALNHPFEERLSQNKDKKIDFWFNEAMKDGSSILTELQNRHPTLNLIENRSLLFDKIEEDRDYFLTFLDDTSRTEINSLIEAGTNIFRAQEEEGNRFLLDAKTVENYRKVVLKQAYDLNNQEIELAATLFNKKVLIVSKQGGRVQPNSMVLNPTSSNELILIFHNGYAHYERCIAVTSRSKQAAAATAASSGRQLPPIQPTRIAAALPAPILVGGKSSEEITDHIREVQSLDRELESLRSKWNSDTLIESELRKYLHRLGMFTRLHQKVLESSPSLSLQIADLNRKTRELVGQFKSVKSIMRLSRSLDIKVEKGLVTEEDLHAFSLASKSLKEKSFHQDRLIYRFQLAFQVQQLFNDTASTFMPKYKSKELTAQDAISYRVRFEALIGLVKDGITHTTTVKTLNQLRRMNEACLKRFPSAKVDTEAEEKQGPQKQNIVAATLSGIWNSLSKPHNS